MVLATQVIVGVSLGMLFASALLSLVRLVLGPTALDRAISIDVITAAVIGTVVVLIAWWQRTDLMVLLIIFALTAFFSTVTVSRYVANTAISRHEESLAAQSRKTRQENDPKEARE
ncbi:monovalent cation/H+ antiporter complex subunit F [Actinomycetaceae bacterium MB13-C1-2]|nr:monovalent cation/H+ antiporter complex subunit F [Actinomycetaceae bacterium MB13-C1-2]